MKFYKEAEFQETPIGKIPKDWPFAKLEETAKVTTGGNAPQGEEYFRDGKCPFIRVQHFDGDRLYVDKWDLINERAVKEYGLKLLPKDSTIFPKSGASINLEKRALLPLDAFVVNHLCVLIPKRKIVDFRFLFYLMKRINLSRTSAGTTLPYLNLETISKVRVPIAPMDEQRGIVEVLGVVDSAIEFADKVIAKTERLKKGLMQQLLTRGIGHKEYKTTPIGKTPNTWQVEKIENVAEIRRNKSINNYEQIAFIPMELVPDSQIYSKYEIRRKEDVKSSTYCEAGDLLLAKITPSLENGKQGIVPSDVSNGIALATTEVFPIHCKGINKLFLFYVLKFSNFRNKIISSMIGSTGRQRASKGSVERLEIPVPPPDEQQRIINIFSTIDKKLELERAEKLRLEKIKKGLMDLFLTGKVRIKVD